MCAGGLARLSCRTGCNQLRLPVGPRRCGASRSREQLLQFSMHCKRLPDPADKLAWLANALHDCCAKRCLSIGERRFAGWRLVAVCGLFAYPSRRTVSREHPQHASRGLVVNAKTQAAVAVFWTVPTPQARVVAAWLTAAMNKGEILRGRPVDLDYPSPDYHSACAMDLLGPIMQGYRMPICTAAA